MFSEHFPRAARSVLGSPRHALPALLSISLGIAATTIIFSLIKGVLLTPLPYHEAERLVLLRARNVRLGETRPFVSVLDFRDFERHARSFEGMALYQFSQLDLRGEGGTERIQGLRVTPEYFSVLGLSAAAGRLPRATSAGEDSDVIVLSRSLWTRRFGADTRLIGNTIAVNTWRSLPGVGSVPYRVLAAIDEPSRFLPMAAGVDQPHLGVDDPVDFWLPLQLDEEALSRRELRDRNGAVARLAPGVTREQAQAELEAIAAALAERYSDTNANWSVLVVPLTEAVAGAIEPALWLLFAGVGLLLLISCSNVASLQIVRALERRPELALRAALGASSFRLVGRVMTEAVTLVMVGGAVGVGLSVAGIRLLKLFAPPQLPRADTIQVDFGVLLFSVVLAAAAGIATGCAPAGILARAPLVPRMGSVGGGGSTTRVGRRLLQALAAFAIGTALALLIGAALLHQSLTRLLAVDPGYERENLLTLTISLPEAKYAWRRNSEFLREVTGRLSSLPGIIAVGAVRGMPGREARIEVPILLPGRQADPHEAIPRAQIRVVSPTYFKAMSIPLLAGRGFEPGDELGEVGYTRVVLVNRTMADRFWPGETAIGKEFGIIGPDLPRVEVVGVVGDVRYRNLESPPGPEIYYPEALFPQALTDLVVRTEAPPIEIASLVQAEIRALEPDVLLTNVGSMEEALNQNLADRRFAAWLLNGFSVAALVLAGIGVSGVVAQNVSLRRGELGVRLALGARTGSIVGMVLRQNLIPTGIGLAVGLLGAGAGTTLLSSFLYAIEPTDATTYLAASVLTAGAATLASFLPARSAARTDPLQVLREE